MDLRVRHGAWSRTRSSGAPLAGLSDFTDLQPVAVGGSSQVFRARQPALDREVAIKVLALAAADPRVRARFARELAITGKLSAHPLLVSIHGHGVSDAGYPYLVMPWYEGGSLADVLRRDGPMPVTAVLTTGVRIGAALAHVHAHGLVHRDVKPGNVLLTAHGDAVLSDFGGAAHERDAPTATTVVSPLHVAPETLLGAAATARSDIWSLTSTLCTALAGQPPFVVTGPSGELVRDLTRLEAAPPPLLRPDVPTALRDLLLAGLATRPDQRPSAAELTAALRGVQASLGLRPTDVPEGASVPVLPATPALAWGRTASTPALAEAPTPVDDAAPRQEAAPPPDPVLPSSLPPVTSVPPAPAPTWAPMQAPAPGEHTVLRPAPRLAHRRSRRATVGLAVAGGLAGAALGLGVLATGQALLVSDDASTGADRGAAVVRPDSDR